MNKKIILILIFVLGILLSIRITAGEWSYYVNDHLGSTRVILNESGNVKQYYDYDPFGKTLRESIAGTEKAKYRFTGKELDEEAVYTDRGLDWYYFGARYYDPVIGRFLTPDPLAANSPSLTPYHYAANNPLKFIDPTGMDTLQAQQLNQILEQTHNNFSNQTVVCNTSTLQAVSNYLTQQNVNAPTELINSQGNATTANQMIQNIANSENFETVTPQQAIELVNNGAVVIAGQEGAQYGHVDVVGAGGSLATGNAVLQGQNPRSIGNSTLALQGSWEERGRISWSFSSAPTYYHYNGFAPRPNIPNVNVIQPQIMMRIPNIQMNFVPIVIR